MKAFELILTLAAVCGAASLVYLALLARKVYFLVDEPETAEERLNRIAAEAEELEADFAGMRATLAAFNLEPTDDPMVFRRRANPTDASTTDSHRPAADDADSLARAAAREKFCADHFPPMSPGDRMVISQMLMVNAGAIQMHAYDFATYVRLVKVLAVHLPESAWTGRMLLVADKLDIDLHALKDGATAAIKEAAEHVLIVSKAQAANDELTRCLRQLLCNVPVSVMRVEDMTEEESSRLKAALQSLDGSIQSVECRANLDGWADHFGLSGIKGWTPSMPDAQEMAALAEALKFRRYDPKGSSADEKHSSTNEPQTSASAPVAITLDVDLTADKALDLRSVEANLTEALLARARRAGLVGYVQKDAGFLRFVESPKAPVNESAQALADHKGEGDGSMRLTEVVQTVVDPKSKVVYGSVHHIDEQTRRIYMPVDPGFREVASFPWEQRLEMRRKLVQEEGGRLFMGEAFGRHWVYVVGKTGSWAPTPREAFEVWEAANPLGQAAPGSAEPGNSGSTNVQYTRAREGDCAACVSETCQKAPETRGSTGGVSQTSQNAAGFVSEGTVALPEMSDSAKQSANLARVALDGELDALAQRYPFCTRFGKHQRSGTAGEGQQA